MALTLTKIRDPLMPTGQSVCYDATFSSSYPAGGEPLKATDLGLTAIDWLEAKQKGLASRLITYDYVGNTLRAYTALGTEAGTASDQSAITVRIFAVGPNKQVPRRHPDEVKKRRRAQRKKHLGNPPSSNPHKSRRTTR